MSEKKRDTKERRVEGKKLEVEIMQLGNPLPIYPLDSSSCRLVIHSVLRSLHEAHFQYLPIFAGSGFVFLEPMRCTQWGEGVGRGKAYISST